MNDYEFEKWLDEHKWCYTHYNGHMHISFNYHDNYEITYLNLSEGKFTFWCKSKKDFLGTIDIKFDTPFNENPDYIETELFKQLDEFIKNRKEEKEKSIKKIDKLFSKFL